MLERRRYRGWRLAALALSVALMVTGLSTAFTASTTVQRGRIPELNALPEESDTGTEKPSHNDDLLLDRRRALLSIATAATLLPLAVSNPATAAESATEDSPVKSLEDLSLGNGQWTQASSVSSPDTSNMIEIGRAHV